MIGVDSILFTTPTEPAVDPNTHELLTKPTLPGFAIPAYDYVAITYNSTSDVYVFKTGGVGGTTVATITINYSDSTKVSMTSVAKT